jgi:hypothetical protein
MRRRATYSAPITVAAPGRFSTTTGWPSIDAIRFASSRAAPRRRSSRPAGRTRPASRGGREDLAGGGLRRHRRSAEKRGAEIAARPRQEAAATGARRRRGTLVVSHFCFLPPRRHRPALPACGSLPAQHNLRRSRSAGAALWPACGSRGRQRRRYRPSSPHRVAAVSPPSTTISVAVMYLASSEARNSAAWATSHPSPMWPIGT